MVQLKVFKKKLKWDELMIKLLLKLSIRKPKLLKSI